MKSGAIFNVSMRRAFPAFGNAAPHAMPIYRQRKESLPQSKAIRKAGPPTNGAYLSRNKLQTSGQAGNLYVLPALEDGSTFHVLCSKEYGPRPVPGNAMT